MYKVRNMYIYGCVYLYVYMCMYIRKRCIGISIIAPRLALRLPCHPVDCDPPTPKTKTLPTTTHTHHHNQALVGMPPDTLNGRFRVTEQGEMITQNFGHRAVAEATLDLYSAGVLAEAFQTPVHPPPEWRGVMQRLADIGCEHYRATVRGDPRFVPYFRAATPEQELGTANIGGWVRGVAWCVVSRSAGPTISPPTTQTYGSLPNRPNTTQ